MKLYHISDLDLVNGFKDLVIEEQERLVLQLEYLAELDRRKLTFEYPSLWAYLVHECGMEESSALRRIRAARLLKNFPSLKAPLESGKLNITLLELAQSCANREGLSNPEFLELTESIIGMSSRKAKREIATRYPQDIETPHDDIRPLSGDLSEVRFVAPNDLIEKLEEIRNLLAHSHPGANLAELIDIMATEFKRRHHPEERAKRAEDRKEKRQECLTERNDLPSAPTVHFVPTRSPSQPIVHALVLRDGYRCSYVDPISKKRCESTHGLQIDHVHSWARGGETELDNLRFLCGNHHRRVSFLEFGESAKYEKRQE